VSSVTLAPNVTACRSPGLERQERAVVNWLTFIPNQFTAAPAYKQVSYAIFGPGCGKPMLCVMKKMLYFHCVKSAAQIQEELAKLKPELVKRFFVSSIGLFGSYVRNEQKEESDLDIIVDFSQPVGIEFIDLADFLEDNLRTKVDLVSLNGIKPKYLEAIKPEILYV
jgi:hypothetical protein